LTPDKGDQAPYGVTNEFICGRLHEAEAANITIATLRHAKKSLGVITGRENEAGGKRGPGAGCGSCPAATRQGKMFNPLMFKAPKGGGGSSLINLTRQAVEALKAHKGLRTPSVSRRVAPYRLT
jgi:hypothetical protein